MAVVLTFYLSRIIKQKINFPGNLAGIVKDIIVDISSPRPKVFAVSVKIQEQVKYYEMSNVDILKTKGKYKISCNTTENIDITKCLNLVFLKESILDKQIIDINGRKLVRVNDIRLASVSSGTFAIAVDIGMEGLFRRLGIAKQLKKIFKLFGQNLPSKFVLWDDVETVGTIHPGIQLSKTFNKLHELHPSDLADIIEDLDKSSQTAIFTSLEEEHAADVLEQMEVSAQVHIIETLSIEKAADVLEKMPADEAADIIDELETHKQEALLKEMVHESSEEIRELLEYSDKAVGSIMSTELITFYDSLVVSEAISKLRSIKPENESTYLFFITDKKKKLIATVTLRELILAHPLALLSDIMNKKLITVQDTDQIDTLAEIISKYKMLAIPVINSQKQLEGMVVIDDIVEDLLKAGKTK